MSEKIVDIRTYLSDIHPVDGKEFIRRLRRLAKKQGTDCRFEKHHGKGSHGTVYYGGNKTTIKDRKKEIGPGLLRAMCAQLGINTRDL